MRRSSEVGLFQPVGDFVVWVGPTRPDLSTGWMIWAHENGLRGRIYPAGGGFCRVRGCLAYGFSQWLDDFGVMGGVYGLCNT